MTTKIIFNEETAAFIIKAIGKTINENGIITELDGSPVLSNRGEEINILELGGIANKKFYKSDLSSIMDLVEEEKMKRKCKYKR